MVRCGGVQEHFVRAGKVDDLHPVEQKDGDILLGLLVCGRTALQTFYLRAVLKQKITYTRVDGAVKRDEQTTLPRLELVEGAVREIACTNAGP
jgi:hypothetical protein